MSEDGKWICYGCVGDQFLVRKIRSEGSRHNCTFCSKKRKCFSLATVSDLVHTIFLGRYHNTTVYDRGDGAVSCIAEILSVDEEPIAEAVFDYLSDHCRGWHAHDGDDNPYDKTYSYLATHASGRQYARKWRELRRSLLHESRYFNLKARKILDEIFDGLDFGLAKLSQSRQQLSAGSQSVVTTLTPESGRGVLYRARVARDGSQVIKFLSNPTVELAPPPPEIARAGRMNPTGVSLFYGAAEAQTCVSEVRPPVGAYAVIARFQIIRPVRLLDFDKLTEAFESLPHFHPQYDEKRDRDAFLSAFAFEVSIPVHPENENLGYLPTQAVAEYLAQRDDLQLDGVIFPSTQSGNSARNIVLFQHSARVESGAFRYVAQQPDHFDDASWITIKVTPRIESSPEESAPPSSIYPTMRDMAEEIWEEPDEPKGPDLPPPTLRLDPQGFVIEKISSVNYGHVTSKISYPKPGDEGEKPDF